MTCKQTRQLLAAYRREDLSPGESAELQAHLAGCAECRARAAEFRQMGEALQALPKLAPPPDFYARVMAAVRAEEEQAAGKKQEQVIIPGMTDVAYLPTVRRAVTERRARVTPLRSQMSPAGVFALHYGAGLAALFLIFALGVSAGLFFLRNNPGVTPDTPLPHPQILTSVYTPDPAYPLVASATASPDGQYVMYAAHTASGNWMLEELNRQTQKSTALLPSPVAGPLVLEGWARSWVLWAQGDPVAGHQWQLDATELSPALPGAAQPVRLLQSNEAGPDGKVTALHGVATLGSTVLLAEELADGHGQLVALDLSGQSGAARTVIAAAQQPDHLIADPTAAIADPKTGGMTVYWAEQWHDPDGTLHGNIWRRSVPDSSAVPVTSNGVSFSPAIVAGKVFWLEEPPAQGAGAADGQQAPTPTPTATGTVAPGSGDAAGSQVTGIIWSENLDGRLDLDTGAKTLIAGTNTAPVSNLQAGLTFVLWQAGRGDYSLYDVTSNQPQPLNSSITNPLDLSVSPTAILWMTSDQQSSSQVTPVRTTINLLEWPQSRS